MNDLQEIFNSITPDNIKSNPVINEFMNALIKVIEKQSKQSIDIFTFLENNNIKSELFKTYLSDLYTVLEGISNNQKLIDAIERRNSIYEEYYDDYEFIAADALENLINNITEEHFLAFKGFREKKGTVAGIRYLFYFISTLFNIPASDRSININTPSPWVLEMDGSLPPEFYHYLITPLAHPAGYIYTYVQSVISKFVDYYFPTTINFINNGITVVCKRKDPDNPNNEIITNFDFSDRDVVNVEASQDELTWPRWRIITFENGDYLKNTITSDGGSTVILYDSNDSELNTFGSYCTLEYNIKEEVITTFSGITDEITIEMGTVFEDDKGAFVNFEALPYWNQIGSPGHNNSIGGWDPAVANQNRIGSPGMVIGGYKAIYLDEPGFDLEVAIDIPPRDVVNEIYEGKKTINGRPAIIRKITNSSYEWINVSGDIYALDVRTEDGKTKFENGFSHLSDEFEIKIV